MAKLSDIRNGAVTSSKIYKICDGVKDITVAGMTYINSKRAERKLKRRISVFMWWRIVLKLVQLK